MKYLELTVGAVLVYNFVLSRFLGICPFLGVSKRLSTAMGMSGAVIFVMTLASFITTLLYRNVLQFSFGGEKIDLIFLQVLVFILVIAALVQLIEIMLQKLSPVLYQALGIYLPLITTNCAVLGAAISNIDNGYSFIGSMVFGVGAGLGYTLAIVLFASIRERLDATAQCPKCFEGFPIALVSAALLAMSFMGFSGLSIW